MLQQAASKPAEEASSSFNLVDHTNPCQSPPARMSILRDSPDVKRGLSTELVQQEECRRRNLVTELVKEQSGMTANKGTPFNRSCRDLRRDRELVFTGEYVEWEGALRGCKRREISVERESRSEECTEKDHQLVHSGSSDLTTEQSAICMAAESNSTRTTGSLDEDGCLLKLQSTAPAAVSYGNLRPNEKADIDDEEEDNGSTPFPNLMQAACARYDINRPAACASSYDHHTAGQDWLATSHDDVKGTAAACASLENYQQDNKAGDDWLELRLGSNFLALHMSSKTFSPSPCTLQLLPQEPDCALMKEREKYRELTLCSEDHSLKKPLICKKAELPSTQATRPPLVLQSYINAKSTRENFYTSLLKSSCLPLAFTDSIGQFTASPATSYASPTDVSLYPTLSPLDHHASHHVHQGQPQLQAGINVQYRAPLHASQEQRPFESMSLGTCVSSREGVNDAQEAAHKSTVSRSPLPDFVHQNWDQLASSSPACSIMQPVTSFRDLIASSFLKEPCNRYDGSVPLLTSLQQPAASQTWSAKFCSQNSSSSDPTEWVNANNIEKNYMSSLNMGCRSMTSWLSEALAASENLCVDQRLDNRLSPEASLTPSLTSRKQINADRRLAKRVSKSSGQHVLKFISRPASRGSSGFWFALQPSEPEDCDAEITSAEADAKSVSYIRMKNGDVPISAVKKFLIAKLGLSHDSQIGLACRGKMLEEEVDLKSIQEEIWLSCNFAHKERLSFKSSQSKVHVFKDTLMVLTYQIS